MNPFVRTARITVGSALAAASLATAGLVLSPLAQADYSPLAVTTGVNIRQDPNTNSTVLAVLSAGDTVTQRGDEQNGWLPITYNQKNAWVLAQYVSATTAVTSQSTQSTALVATSAYVRSSASDDAWIMGSLAKGTSVPVIGQPKDGWTPVNYYGRSGWVATSLLSSTSTDASVKITTAISNDYLWVRTGESTAYQSIGMLYPGDKAAVTGDPSNGWIPITFKGQAAFVAANYARYTSDPSTISLLSATTTSNSTSSSKSTAADASATKTTAAQPTAAAVPTDTAAAAAVASAPVASPGTTTTPGWTTTAANLRIGPGSDTQSVRVLAAKIEVSLTGTTNGGWSQVLYNGSKYWISTGYVSATKPTDTDATPEPEASTDTSTPAAQTATSTSPAAQPAVSSTAAPQATPSTPAATEPSTPAAIPASSDTSSTNTSSDTSSSTVGPSASALPQTTGTKYTTEDVDAYLGADQSKPAIAVIPKATSVATTDTVQNNRVQVVWDNTAYWVNVDSLSSTKPADTTDTSSTADASSTTPAPSTNAPQAAIDFAMSKVGMPYIWGGTGPSGYDCSGLVQAAYKSAGISLPRTTWDQVNAGTRVSLADAEPGDLVFFYDDSHVGIYIGNGQVVNALNENTGIVVSQISYLGTPSAVVRLT
ncbi:SH3 domain-containing protein [Propionibacterium sp.]|uniref:SH3 domain-containing protein n=1 Tax=Propionibacterium sp. TaxID=1977903 RepID=UPI0039E992D6